MSRLNSFSVHLSTDPLPSIACTSSNRSSTRVGCLSVERFYGLGGHHSREQFHISTSKSNYDPLLHIEAIPFVVFSTALEIQFGNYKRKDSSDSATVIINALDEHFILVRRLVLVYPDSSGVLPGNRHHSSDPKAH